MNDKKQIEEMVEFFKGILPTKAMADWIPIKIKHDYKGYATALYNAGYRKIPEDSVVLSREEYDEDYATKQDRDYWKHKAEMYKDRLKTRLPQNPEGSIVVDKEYLKKELQGLEHQARKETAEEFARYIFNHITKPEVWDELRTLWLNVGGGKKSNLPIWNLLIEPVAKQFGVEVEE